MGRKRSSQLAAGLRNPTATGPSQPPATRRFRGTAAFCGLLLLAIGVVFGQTVRYGFVNYDDNEGIYANKNIKDGLTADGVKAAFTEAQASNWVPLCWISHMVDCQFYGIGRPGGHHLTNVLLHGATAVLLCCVLWQMTGRAWPSALAAGLFAIHPLRAESVAWITERKDVLSGLFFVLTLWAYAGYVRCRQSAAMQHVSRLRPVVWYLAVLLLFALGLMSKPMLVTLPFVLLLLDWWPLGRLSIKPRPVVAPSGHQTTLSAAGATTGRGLVLLEKVPMLLLVGLSCAVTVWAQRQALASKELSLPWRVGNALVAYVDYLVQLLYPAGLAVFYPHPDTGLAGWKIAGAVAILAAVCWAVWLLRQRSLYLAVGWLWYLGTMVPVIGLVQVGMQAMADRYTYLPQIGLGVALAWGLADAVQVSPARRSLYGVTSAILLSLLVAVAWRQTSFWSDSATLWTRAMACTAGNSVAHGNFGHMLDDQKRFDDAIAHYEKALEAAPDLAEIQANLGITLANQQRWDEAIVHDEKALEGKNDSAKIHRNLGVALAHRGQLDEAIAHLETAVKTEPGSAEMHSDLGNAYLAARQFDGAMTHFQLALKLRPVFPEAGCNLGVVLIARKQYDAATAQFQSVLRTSPDCADAYKHLGDVMLDQRRFVEAAGQYRKALKLAMEQNDGAMVQGLRQRLAVCEAGIAGGRPASTGPAKSH